MGLSKLARLALKGLDFESKRRIADAAGMSVSTLYRKIATNDDDLTKEAIKQLIIQETGIPESEVLAKCESQN
jgi:hypothetical protein